METELLSVHRCSLFVAFCMERDLQVLAHRREGAGLLRSTLAKPDDDPIMEISSDKFDKIMTFFSQNDTQVHYAGADRSVGVYAIVKLLGELRRRLRDFPHSQLAEVGMPLLSPRDFTQREIIPREDQVLASTGRGTVPSLDFSQLGKFEATGKGPQVAEGSAAKKD